MASSSSAVLIVLVLVVIVVVAWIYWPPKPGKRCVSAAGAPTGDCDYDSDCEHGGHCTKDPTGKCVCACAPGYSGKHCETTGVPYNSYNCMGPNQVPPNPAPGSTGSPNNLCVCPPGNWVSGTDSTGQYVQCLKCADNWGPINAGDACTMQWTTAQNVVTRNCYGEQNFNNDFGQAVCDAEFGAYAQQTGPGNVQGSTVTQGPCSGYNQCNSCPGGYTESSTGMCTNTGWMLPSVTPVTCASVLNNPPRACSSYSCYTTPPR
jgi:hypothetical protein